MSPAAPLRGSARRVWVAPGPPSRRPASRQPATRRLGGCAVRAGLLGLLLAGLLVARAGPAGAHPLGNFTVSSSSGLGVGPERLEVDHVVDMAEIPAFQTRQAIDADHDGKVGAVEAAAWRDHECPRLAGGLRATVDGQPLALAVTGSRLTFPEGAGGLATLRLECALSARLPVGREARRSLTYADRNQPGRVGWREITAVGDRTTIEAADVPPVSPSARLTAYPEDQLSSPLDQRTATLRFHPGGPAPGNPTPGNPTSGCGAPPEGEPSRTQNGVPRVVHTPRRGGRPRPGRRRG